MAFFNALSDFTATGEADWMASDCVTVLGSNNYFLFEIKNLTIHEPTIGSELVNNNNRTLKNKATYAH